MRILITDVTVMHNNMFCVAGWCAKEKRMIRPLLGGHHWTLDLIARLGIVPGVTLNVVPTGPTKTNFYPHSTEDQNIDPAKIEVVEQAFLDWLGPQRPRIDQSLS
ncbi:hypothetical protein, partial [Methylocystis parvus]|uniref:hypothetical protein n=1 Tax=Methylocystis parvus TaxID=134 RepID=UPI001AEC5A6B